MFVEKVNKFLLPQLRKKKLRGRNLLDVISPSRTTVWLFPCPQKYLVTLKQQNVCSWKCSIWMTTVCKEFRNLLGCEERRKQKTGMGCFSEGSPIMISSSTQWFTQVTCPDLTSLLSLHVWCPRKLLSHMMYPPPPPGSGKSSSVVTFYLSHTIRPCFTPMAEKPPKLPKALKSLLMLSELMKQLERNANVFPSLIQPKGLTPRGPGAFKPAKHITLVL